MLAGLTAPRRLPPDVAHRLARQAALGTRSPRDDFSLTTVFMRRRWRLSVVASDLEAAGTTALKRAYSCIVAERYFPNFTEGANMIPARNTYQFSINNPLPK